MKTQRFFLPLGTLILQAGISPCRAFISAPAEAQLSLHTRQRVRLDSQGSLAFLDGSKRDQHPLTMTLRSNPGTRNVRKDPTPRIHGISPQRRFWRSRLALALVATVCTLAFPARAANTSPILSPMLSRIDELRLAARLWYAALLGAAVGKERSTASHHPAGARTLALVSLGSASFTLCSIYGFGRDATRFDTSRMASAVASGVSFIGAGVITTTTRRKESVVHGLTTAAAVWIAAAVGVTCGAGLYILSTCTAMAALGFLRIGGNVKHHHRKDLLRPHHNDEEENFEDDLPEALQKLQIDWNKVDLTSLIQSADAKKYVKIDDSFASKHYVPGEKGQEESFYDNQDEPVVVGLRNETDHFHHKHPPASEEDDNVGP